MKIIYKQDKDFLFYWNQFIANNNVSFRFSKLLLLFRIKSCINCIDKSFVVIKNNECVGICFLPIEENNGVKTISIGNSYTIAPLFKDKKVEKFIFDNIDKIVKEENVKQVKFFIEPLIYEKNNNYLLKYGFINSSTTTCLVDLSIQKEKLWTNIRKHYKSMINKVLKNEKFEFIIINKNNANYEIHEKYRLLHYKCAGRVTRSKQTFDIQFEMLKNGYSTLIGLKYEDNYIGMQYFNHLKNGASYASGADDPDYTKKGFNIYHPILWKAQIYLKELGIKYLDYSQPCGYSKVQGFDDYLDDKQLNISYFKRGMGAEPKTLYRGIKYYDKSLFEKDIEIFKRKVII